MKSILTIREISQEFGVAPFAVRNWVKRGELPVLHAGKRVYINRTRFTEFLEKGTVTNTEIIERR